ncbi:MAG: ATP-binding cassette domain-containing protein [Propionibacteriaceae bacterium]|uniref:Phosphate-transporting ATPase/adenosinetriphosphatase n=1 Tax=Propionibacterium ruminifibrarum TaxID=1962131 RepID=A0A375I406_9ACTN|nr:phosphate ABC transporter ATP-binding protein [Propionibacterium ruminifibrarum]MBE6478531.1 ATP-binding cassette domain-containing protein [Propionibacteriaceae bacterium]SPF68030.1 phosphate-transporting ATPase/adenosinetriphosphatase [Propionibacterium ruminifibrarum]
MARRVELRHLSARYGALTAVQDVSMTIEPRSVTAFIGPSGCGKSTMLRAMNRMLEVIPNARVEGRVLLDGTNIYGRMVDPVRVRRTVGMVYQQPNPFPTMSIRDNVLAGVHLTNRRLGRAEADTVVETCLRGTNLWEEVRERLDEPATGLSGGQQRRLCIARAVAVEPEVLLLDEPCSALDPISTQTIEELIGRLREDRTVVIVTHNMRQAARVSERTAFFSTDGPGTPGRLVEYDDTATLFSNPRHQQTEDYITGRLG